MIKPAERGRPGDRQVRTGFQRSNPYKGLSSIVHTFDGVRRVSRTDPKTRDTIAPTRPKIVLHHRMHNALVNHPPCVSRRRIESTEARGQTIPLANVLNEYLLPVRHHHFGDTPRGLDQEHDTRIANQNGHCRVSSSGSAKWSSVRERRLLCSGKKECPHRGSILGTNALQCHGRK